MSQHRKPTPQEIAMRKAEELYAGNQRWRTVIDGTTYAALESMAATHSPFALAREAAMIMLGRIFCESGELQTLQAILDKTNTLLLDQVKLAPPPQLAITFATDMSALRSAEAWLSRWASHVGNCQGGEQCTCGLTAVRSEAALAIQEHDHPREENPQ